MGSTISYSSGIDATNHSDSCSEENAEICTEVYIKGDSEVSFYSNNLLCKVNLLFCKVIFFPPKFPFPKNKRKIWREKNYFANERGPFLLTL
jgi:hypothetical protein